MHCFLGDVRDREKMTLLAEGMDIIIHAAAFKHVILSEYNPTDVVQTNILGVENVIHSDISKARRVLGLEPGFGLYEGRIRTDL